MRAHEISELCVFTQFERVLYDNLGEAIVTTVSSGIEDVIQTFPPITASFPIIVFPPRIVAPAYIVTLSSIVGWRFLPLSLEI